MLFLLLVVFQEAFHQPFGECLTIGIHHQPTLIERIMDITQLHKDGSGSGMGFSLQMRLYLKYNLFPFSSDEMGNFLIFILW